MACTCKYLSGKESNLNSQRRRFGTLQSEIPLVRVNTYVEDPDHVITAVKPRPTANKNKELKQVVPALFFIVSKFIQSVRTIIYIRYTKASYANLDKYSGERFSLKIISSKIIAIKDKYSGERFSLKIIAIKTFRLL